MGLRCEVLGHEYGDPTIDESREDREQGVVLISREYRVCERCGDEDEFYQNERVIASRAVEADRADGTSGDGAGGDGGDPDDRTEPDPDAGAPVEADSTTRVVTLDSTIDASSEVLAELGNDGEGTDTPPDVSTAESDATRAQGDRNDDGVILPSGSADTANGPRGSIDPETGVTGTADPPDRGQDADAGVDAASSTTGFTVPTPTERRFRCPECGHEEPAESTSLCEGDLCFACHRGYFTAVPE